MKRYKQIHINTEEQEETENSENQVNPLANTAKVEDSDIDNVIVDDEMENEEATTTVKNDEE